MSSDETRLAEEIVSVLPAGSVVRQCSDDRRTIRFAVRKAAARLRAIVLSKASLRRLVTDPLRQIKIEYLQRDLLRSLGRRVEFRYPHPGAAARPQPPQTVAISR